MTPGTRPPANTCACGCGGPARNGITVLMLEWGLLLMRLEMTARRVPLSQGGGVEVVLLSHGNPLCGAMEDGLSEAVFAALSVAASMRAAMRGSSDA